MNYTYNDGGRKAAGFKGSARDCVTRAIAIASDRDYREVYNQMAEINRKTRGVRSARTGINTKRRAFKVWMEANGFEWVSTKKIGSPLRIRVRADELPPGRLVLKLTGHCAAVIDGVVHDTFDPSNDGRRIVYGYWRLTAPAPGA